MNKQIIKAEKWTKPQSTINVIVIHVITVMITGRYMIQKLECVPGRGYKNKGGREKKRNNGRKKGKWYKKNLISSTKKMEYNHCRKAAGGRSWRKPLPSVSSFMTRRWETSCYSISLRVKKTREGGGGGPTLFMSFSWSSWHGAKRCGAASSDLVRRWGCAVVGATERSAERRPFDRCMTPCWPCGAPQRSVAARARSWLCTVTAATGPVHFHPKKYVFHSNS